MRLLLLLVLVLLQPVSAQAGQATTQQERTRPERSPGWHESSLQHDGLTRYFRYYIPTRLKKTPALLMVFHGGTRSMRKIFSRHAGGLQEWRQLAEDNGFLLLAPNGVNIKTGDTRGDHQSWNDCRMPVEGNNSASRADDTGFANALIDWSQVHFSTDPDRVYITGASNGGMMSLRLVTELPERITAAAVFIANQPEQTDCRTPEKPVPLFLLMGTDDPLMPWQGGQILGKGPRMMSAPDTLAFWLKVNRADAGRVQSRQLADIDREDDSIIMRSIYPAAAGGQPVWFYEVRGGGHNLPSVSHKIGFLGRLIVGNQNHDLEATREAWRFLRQFNR
ncbi:MAG TPA: hypothetical protein ENJ11_09565 [Gammaproteobacteria bacterium]|nr:hypothetical protein [Gammaproteobacteria bacterium]